MPLLLRVKVDDAQTALKRYGTVVGGMLQGLLANKERQAAAQKLLGRMDAVAGRIGKIKGDLAAAAKGTLGWGALSLPTYLLRLMQAFSPPPKKNLAPRFFAQL